MTDEEIRERMTRIRAEMGTIVWTDTITTTGAIINRQESILGNPLENIQWLLEQLDQALHTSRFCPCLWTMPCHPQCTCICDFSSRGCMRCCRYGSNEQRRIRAELIATRLGSTTVLI